jgi:predicted DNA-binding transcriptional regulator YafY
VNRTDRLYALVEELRAVAPRPRTATWLTERFEMSTRTIERDLLALLEAGVPIHATTGPGGGYAIDQTHTLPPVNFTPEEATAMAVTLALQANAPFSAAARSALHKVVAAMGDQDAAAARDLSARVQLVDSPDGDRIRFAIPRAAEEALVRQRVLRITYEDGSGQVTQRDVEPIAFVGMDSRWYLIGWCRLREGERSFRVDRMHSAEVTAEPAPARKPGDPGIPDAVIRLPTFE